MLTAVVISIGDELVLGQTVDTNSAWLSRQLAALGYDVAGHLTVPDSRDAISASIRQASSSCDVLVITGGLGPTEDDLTREALADAMEVDLVRDDEALRTLRGFFERINRPMPVRNEVQAFVPRGARAIANPNGTAPGLWAVIGGEGTGGPGGGNTCRVVVMPGVPREMFAMWSDSVAPELARLSNGAVILSRTVHTFGAGESTVAERLGAGGGLMDRARNPSVGTTVSGGIVSLRVNARGTSPEQCRRALDETVAECEKVLGHLVFGYDEQTLAGVVGEMLKASKHPVTGKVLTVATAESCTGGLLAKYLTDVPGSSAYFTHGVVCYANAAKTQLLGVEEALIAHHGAVSEPVASAMARGALVRSGCDLAVSITGIAGPDGGTPTKPVGTVCLALAWWSGPGPDREAVASARTFVFSGDRDAVRDRAAKMGLSLLRFHLLKERPPF